MLEHADRGDGVEAGLGDVAVIHQPDLRELLQALLADLLIPPRDLLFRQRHADGLHPTGGGVAHHPAPAAADVQQAVALGEPQLVEDQAVLILLCPVEWLLRGRALRPQALIPALRGIRLVGWVVGAGIGHGVAEEELVEVIAHVVVALHDLLIPLPGVPGEPLDQGLLPARLVLLRWDRHWPDRVQVLQGAGDARPGGGRWLAEGLVVEGLQGVEHAVRVPGVFTVDLQCSSNIGPCEPQIAGRGDDICQRIGAGDIQPEPRIRRPGLGAVEAGDMERQRWRGDCLHDLRHRHWSEARIHVFLPFLLRCFSVVPLIFDVNAPEPALAGRCVRRPVRPSPRSFRTARGSAPAGRRLP